MNKNSIRDVVLGAAISQAVDTVGNLWSTSFPGRPPPRPSSMPSASARKIVVRARNKYRSRRAMIPRAPTFGYTSLRRTSNPIFSASIGSGVAYFKDVILQDVHHTDLYSAFDVYRIRKVVCQITIDHGVAGSAQTVSVGHCYTACDCTGDSLAPVDGKALGVRANSKYSKISSNDKMLYTFYPKVSNLVEGNSGSIIDSAPMIKAPWLKLSTVGTSIPHNRFLFYGSTDIPTETAKFGFVYTIYFDVKRSS